MASTINAKNTSTGIVITPDASGQLELQTADTTRMTITSSGNVGIGTSSPSEELEVIAGTAQTARMVVGGGDTAVIVINGDRDNSGDTGTEDCSLVFNTDGTYSQSTNSGLGSNGFRIGALNNTAASQLTFTSINSGVDAERMRIDTSGNLLVATTTATIWNSSTEIGAVQGATGNLQLSRSAGVVLYCNRTTDDGTLINFSQAGVTEGTISVSGTTVSYNGGHLSRWSQLENESTQVEIYRGTVLESVDAMCEWYDAEGNLLPNEQATKTIVSTTPASKAVAGVFDRYDEDDEDNPYDFYVAQSGDFVIRLASGTVVQNGDLLESAGDGTARVQADDICRSSTIAKVTSNYVSETYPDGSFCVPCILMIG